MNPRRPSCVTVGAGRAGSAFSRALSTAGYQFAAIISHDADDAKILGERVGAQWGRDWSVVSGTVGFLILAVPDGEIRSALDDALASGSVGSDTIVAHLSGALGSDVLESFRHKGGAAMAFHPAQTILPDCDPATVFDNVVFDMEGDARACALGRRMARDLGGEAVEMTPDTRVIVHAALTVASNFSVAVNRLAERIIAATGISPETARRILPPIILSTGANIAKHGALPSLTGPVSRGDADIVARHIEALAGYGGGMVDVYRMLATFTLAVAREKGALTPAQESALRREIESGK